MTAAGPIGRRRSPGLTRAELVVCLVLGLLAVWLALPWVVSTRDGGRRRACERRMMRAARATLAYEEFSGSFPGYCNVQAIDAQGQPRLTGWVFPLLPFLPQEAPTDQLREGDLGTGGTLGEGGEVGGALGEGQRLAGQRTWVQLYRRFGPGAEDATRGQRPETPLAELRCPSDPRSADRPWSSLVANCGLKDVRPEVAVPLDATAEQLAQLPPPDWVANGPFVDRSRPWAFEATVSLGYLKSRDGAATTLMLSENLDAGLWTDFSEPRVGFVWEPQLVANRRQLLALNLRTPAAVSGGGAGGSGSPPQAAAGEQPAADPFAGYRTARPSSYHPGGVNAAFCDGHTEFIEASIDYLVWCYLLSCDGSEVRAAGRVEPLPPPFRESR